MNKIIITLTVLLFAATTQFATAALTNLLANYNPSFEEGLVHWKSAWTLTGYTSFSIVQYPTQNACGSKFLQITRNAHDNRLTSTIVNVPTSGNYKFSIKAKVKNGAGQDATIGNIWARVDNKGGGGEYQSLAHQVTSTSGKWKKYTGTMSVDKTEARGLGITIDYSIFTGGEIQLDCAKIVKVN